jgi:hypothetical protein
MGTYEHPLHYSANPLGLQLDMRDGSRHFIASQLLHMELNADQTQADIYFSTCTVRIIGSGLNAIMEGLAPDHDSPLGRLARISERKSDPILPPGPGQRGDSKVRVGSILLENKLEPFMGTEPAPEEET